MAYYNWQKTFSFDAEINLIVTARDRGKTFGVRYAALMDAVRYGYRFVEIARAKEEISAIMRGYFDKLVLVNPKEFGCYEFRTEANAAYYRKVAKDENGEVKPLTKWEQIGYYVALSQQQQAKKWTFANVRKIIFDEAIMDKTDRYHRYLPNEWYLLSNLVDTITREQADDETIARVYLLGNACDAVNPYFQHFRIYRKPEYGYHWYKDAGGKKLMLLHFEEPPEEAKARATNTLAGRMLATTEQGYAMLNNDFNDVTDDFIAARPKGSEFQFGVASDGRRYGVWVNMDAGLYYIDDVIPKQRGKSPIWALTTRDNRTNYIVAKRSNNALRAIGEAEQQGLVRYKTYAIRDSFLDVLAWFGIR